MSDLVTMVHHRLGERKVPRDAVRKMRQNGWNVQPAPKAQQQSKKETTKESY